MRMRTWAACAGAGFVLLIGGFSQHHDLRGQTPAVWHDATKVEPLYPQDTPFTVGDCLPGSINPYDFTSDEEVAGMATMTAFTCRSRSSLLTVTWLYLLAVSVYPAWQLLKRCRSR